MMAERSIDHEHNPFWQQGYQDGLDEKLAIAPDEVRCTCQRSDYYAGYAAGAEDRAARGDDTTCEHCGAPATVDAHEDAPFPAPPYWLCSRCEEGAWERQQERLSEESP